MMGKTAEADKPRSRKAVCGGNMRRRTRSQGRVAKDLSFAADSRYAVASIVRSAAAAIRPWSSSARPREEAAMDGLRAIITGSASGLGAATALGLATAGARLVINYASSKSAAERTADQCRGLGAEVAVVQGDVAKDEDCQRIVAAAASWGGLDVLINNAGTTKHVEHGQMDQLSADDFQRIYAVNTIGPFQMVRAARPMLEEGARHRQRSATVVNVSSIAGTSGIGSSLAYVASKGGLNAMTIALARALAPHIRVNAVCPGFIHTPMTRQVFDLPGLEASRARAVAEHKLARFGRPEEVAAAILFLASDEASYITGQALPVDGGNTASLNLPGMKH
jgi:3-oxoacyl-[acyl-carrier protein] reductase